MSKSAKTYLVEFGISMAAYVVVLFVSVWLLERNPDASWRYLLAVAPVVPVLFALRAFLRQLNRIDELQRRIQLNAVAFAAGATGIVTFTYGFLEGIGFPAMSVLYVFPLMIALWGIGVFVARLQYN